jgi:hypothetical protein
VRVSAGAAPAVGSGTAVHAAGNRAAAPQRLHQPLLAY